MHRLAPLLALAGTALAACNGRDEYCGRKYSNITYMGAHDSAFVGSLPMHNQYVPVADQLDLGVRFLQAQTHRMDGAIEMCHTYCWELDAGSLDAYLRAVAAWMGAHPDEVVTLLLTNGDKIPVEDFDAVFRAAGLTQYVMRPQKVMAREEWPTLQEMIDAGTRLVVFMGALVGSFCTGGNGACVWLTCRMRENKKTTTWTRPRSTTSSTNSTTFGRRRGASSTRRFRRVLSTGHPRATLPSSWA